MRIFQQLGLPYSGWCKRPVHFTYCIGRYVIIFLLDQIAGPSYCKWRTQNRKEEGTLEETFVKCTHSGEYWTVSDMRVVGAEWGMAH